MLDLKCLLFVVKKGQRPQAFRGDGRLLEEKEAQRDGAPRYFSLKISFIITPVNCCFLVVKDIPRNKDEGAVQNKMCFPTLFFTWIFCVCV